MLYAWRASKTTRLKSNTLATSTFAYSVYLRAHDVRRVVHGEVGNKARIGHERTLRSRETEVLEDRRVVHQRLSVRQYRGTTG